MKKRFYIGGLLIVLAAIVVGAVLFLGKKVEVEATSKVMVNHPYLIHFSQSLDEASIDNEHIYLTNSAGEKVEVSMKLLNNNKTLAILNAKSGTYTAHIEKSAFKDISSKTEKQEIEFEVVDEIKHIASKEDLQNFFLNVANREKRYYSGGEFETTTVESSDMSAAESKSDSAGSGGSDHSTTNNQVEGIEEGDIVVTDGEFIYSTFDSNIIITDTRDPKNMKQVSKIPLDQYSYPMQMMIHENMLIVIKDQYVETKHPDKQHYMGGYSLTTAAIYNIEDPTNPSLIREVGQDGYMSAVRKYNDVLYIVSNKTPNYWILYDTPADEVELRPYVYDSAEEEKIAPMEIDQLTILPGATEPSYTIISAIDLNNFQNEKIETKGFLGGSQNLYMSYNAIYLTANNYEMPTTLELDVEVDTSDAVSTSIARDMIIAPMSTNTDIYKFSIDGTTINFSASASVEGTVLNQFSMDEYNGHFRIAVTEGHSWGAEPTSKNHLYIFNDKLVKVGEVTDLAKGERIYSARFMGDKAYIVTFKEVDPLFVIDLANPSAPKVLGELKIPGFSNYLHPLDENHLIGIGYDTKTMVDSYSKQPFTVTGGMKISLFDITDFSNPKEQDNVIIGGRGTYSDVQYNHKALFRNTDYSYFGFPITLYKEKGEYETQYQGSGAVIYEITDENGIQLKGNLITPAANGEMYENWELMIQRMLYIDDTLYTVSRNEIKSYDLQTFNLLGSVKLQ
ncbi:beta-propeller domain-containing protein [Ureibacillus acetophenoni]|uniref:Uncharacterized secreted protein with C-terminal beta-propeller domain n=1 Tax=Ureibacillus acetophenoni TaxID=614649 RepID=A0A285URS0_9BACL|nr:beta-propeller domain-containing protein [Ureibacillus acetophenoni]SOC43366.1 uncharacterized secreted protein with C-terminal beta-propeller domain [Ureibacillus acetophenoni]